MAKVLAIVVTYNAMRWIDKCLGSLKESSAKVDIFVVDNGSGDGTPEYITDRYPDVVLTEREDNPGFGAANNDGLRFALKNNYDFVYLLNQDAWVEKDTISTLISAWNDSYGILSPVQNNAKGKMDKKFRKKCGKRLKKADASVSGDNLIVTVPFVMAAHWLMSRQAIETVGGFSPAFRQYGEDDNYINRLHFHGLKAGVVPTAKAVHDRAERKTTREQKMRLKCVATVVKMSNPNYSFFGRHLLEPLELIGMTIKNFSLVPVKFIPELLRRYKELKALRKQSKKKGAFLEESAL